MAENIEIRPGEARFDISTFGHLIENFEPTGFYNPDKTDLFEQKNILLALCQTPEVIISPKQTDFIKGFLNQVFEVPTKVKPGGEDFKVDSVKELILATYMNSLH